MFSLFSIFHVHKYCRRKMGFGFDPSMERQGAESAFWWPCFSLFHCLTGTFAEGHTSRAAGKDLDQKTFFSFCPFPNEKITNTWQGIFFLFVFWVLRQCLGEKNRRYRPEVWWSILGCAGVRQSSPTSYHEYLQGPVDAATCATIECDLPRTFPNHKKWPGRAMVFGCFLLKKNGEFLGE